MKCSTAVAIAMCGVLAFAVAGCKYDDVGAGVDGDQVAVSDHNPTDIEGDVGGMGNGAGAGATDMATASAVDPNDDSVSLENATGLPFDQDPNFTRCTDVDFAPVYFGFDASNLQPSELAKIEAVAKELTAKPNRVVIVEGNCDERGSNEYNLSLGDFRAVSIRDYLVTLGVDAARVQTKSYGEEKPAVAGSGESVWRLNRRGEFAVFQHK